MAGPATVEFGNLTTEMGFTFTYQAGVRPSTCYVYTPSYQYGETGSPSWVDDLLLKFDGVELRFRDCILDEPAIRAQPTQGAIWTLPIKDRRWQWQYGRVYGRFNERKANGQRKDPRSLLELLTMCCDAIGETNPMFNLPPNLDGHYPEVNWSGQSAADELERLALEVDCVVTLNPFMNRLEVNRTDTGSWIPPVGNRTAGFASTTINPQAPSHFLGEAGPTMFQADWSLEPVGLDTDGKWKLIDDLSFKRVPWTVGEALGGFHRYSPLDTYKDIHTGQESQLRDLAAAHVFKSFRVHGSFELDHPGGALEVPRFLPPGQDWKNNQEPGRWLDIQLLNRLAKESEDADGALFAPPPQAFGRWFRLGRGPQSGVYPFGFSFNTEERVITFGEVMFVATPTQGLQPAQMYLTCAFYAGRYRDWHRFRTAEERNQVIKSATHVVQNNDIYGTVIYDGVGVDDNKQAVLDSLDYYVQGEKLKYQSRYGDTVNARGLWDNWPDGRIQQVTWSAGPKTPCMTFISRGQRHDRYRPPLEHYALQHKLHDSIKRNQALTDKMMARIGF